MTHILTISLLLLIGAVSAGAQSVNFRMVEEVELSAPGIEVGDLWGYDVSLAENRALIGVRGEGESVGAAYVFVYSQGVWSQEAKLTASDAAEYDDFGSSVSLSGNRALIGVPGGDDGGDESGAVYVFARSGNAWTQEAKLTPSDAAAGDQFGFHVSLAGDRALVGSVRDDDAGESSGSAYIFVRSNDVWEQEAKLTAADAEEDDRFGFSVSLSGEHAIVGSIRDDDAGPQSGSAYVFVRSGGTWAQEAKLVAADGGLFGASVALSEDLALVGAPAINDYEGAAYVFTRSGNVWTQEATLAAADAARGSVFGWSVSLSEDRALVGAFEDVGAGDGVEVGSAYLFARSGGEWSQRTKLTAEEPTNFAWFGHSVSLSGDRALIGAPGSSGAGPTAGAAYVFSDIGSVDTELEAETTILELEAAPNPARGTVTLRLTTDASRSATVELYDVIGHRIAVLHKGMLVAGTHALRLDGGDLPSGVYIVRAETGDTVLTRRVTLLR